MKKLLLTLLFLFVMVASASGSTVTFPKFTVDVPEGWTYSQDGTVVALLAPGHTAAISIVRDKTQGMTGKDLATAMSRQLKGTKPIPADDGFRFTFKNKHGVESKSFLAINGEEYIMFTITGQDPHISQILNSIKDR
jgi:hypothetical protein